MRMFSDRFKLVVMMKIRSLCDDLPNTRPENQTFECETESSD